MLPRKMEFFIIIILNNCLLNSYKRQRTVCIVSISSKKDFFYPIIKDHIYGKINAYSIAKITYFISIG